MITPGCAIKHSVCTSTPACADKRTPVELRQPCMKPCKITKSPNDFVMLASVLRQAGFGDDLVGYIGANAFPLLDGV